MKTMHRLLCALALAGLSAVAAAHGNVQCHAPAKAEWKKQMELQDELQKKGWKVRQVKELNDCYEVYGFDEKGARVEAFFHPKTFERVMPVEP